MDRLLAAVGSHIDLCEYSGWYLWGVCAIDCWAVCWGGIDVVLCVVADTLREEARGREVR